uniref:NADH-ubiquinone oxidoreductase chain 6 n=1 Tax=Ameiurus melas TaxID=219545 RepID=A0A0S3H7V7_AMEME|nr:NADH dehydrogenase subunit 6 [Ameiurus melas]
MTAFLDLFMLTFVVGYGGVPSYPAAYFAAVRLAVAGGVRSGDMAGHGGSLDGLMLFLFYWGGLFVVFAYSAALAAVPFPETWGAGAVKVYVLMYLFGVGDAVWLFWGGHGGYWVMDDFKEFFTVRGHIAGISLMFSVGGGMLVVCAWLLFFCLCLILELTRRLSRGALRAV